MREVLDGEQNGEDPFGHQQVSAVARVHGRDAVQDHHGDAQEYRRDERAVERTFRRGVVLEDDVANARSERAGTMRIGRYDLGPRPCLLLHG